MKTIMTYGWTFDPVSIALVILLCVCYARLYRFRPHRKLPVFIAALLLLLICLVSPLHFLSAHYLFSIHMIVHVLMLLVVPPLLVMALPGQLPVWLQQCFRMLDMHPLFCWAAGVVVMWFWHVPFVFNAAMQHHAPGYLHLLELLSLMVSGLIFSAPVIGPYRGMHPLTGVLYLTSACVFCSLLGLLITFAPAGVYHHYLRPHDPYGINTLIRQRWSITRSEDQQAAGLIMWVPCCMIYVAASLLLLKRWFNSGHKKTWSATAKNKIL